MNEPDGGDSAVAAYLESTMQILGFFRTASCNDAIVSSRIIVQIPSPCSGEGGIEHLRACFWISGDSADKHAPYNAMEIVFISSSQAAKFFQLSKQGFCLHSVNSSHRRCC